MSSPVVLITGAGRGIGAATAKVLAEQGAKVGVLARRRADAEAVVAALPAGSALALGCDVRDRAGLREALEALEEAFGPLTALINNAAIIGPLENLHEADPDVWAETIDVNLSAALWVIQAVLPGFLAQGSGTIVNISSGAAHKPIAGWSAYCASKAGLAMLTQSLHLEYAAAGVRVFGIAPGVVDTGMQTAIRASGHAPERLRDRSNLAQPDAPAKIIAALLSSAAEEFRGQELDVRSEHLQNIIK
jgi:NAD(P)-dependent dehydrogenase (short-subunit alcohol dehydrogenase family)